MHETIGSVMDIGDYLIDQSEKDWGTLLAPWAELLPASFSLWFVNRFGDLITILDDGSIHLLDVGIGTFERIADSREQFIAAIEIDENADDWLMIPLVDQCVDAGLLLQPGQCYSYKVPPSIDGEYAVDNIVTADLAENYARLADVWRQIKDLPEGTLVRVEEKP